MSKHGHCENDNMNLTEQLLTYFATEDALTGASVIAIYLSFNRNTNKKHSASRQ